MQVGSQIPIARTERWVRHLDFKPYLWATLLILLGSHHLAMAGAAAGVQPAPERVTGGAFLPAYHLETAPADVCTCCVICPVACPFQQGAAPPRPLSTCPVPPVLVHLGAGDCSASAGLASGPARIVPIGSASKRHALSQVFRL